MSNRAFNFTDRDYASIRDQLADYLKFRIPGWNPDPSDFAYSVLEGMAYLGDMMSYYVDRAAQESNILTANDPENIYNLARLHGYAPGLAESAWCIAYLTNEADTDVIIPKGTQIAAVSGGYAFEVTGDVLIVGGGTTADVIVYEGTSRYAEIGVSNGSSNQKFRLPDTKIDGRYGTLTVLVWNPVDSTEQELWSFRELLLDAPSGDYVFSARRDADGSTYLVFGDGVAGRIPQLGWNIGVHYRVTAGAAANGLGGITDSGSLSRFLSTWDDPTSAQFAQVTVSGSTSPMGGRDAESIDNVRAGVVNLIRSQRRAVTAFDYESIARSESTVLDAVCQTTVWSRPTIWVAPKDSSLLLLYSLFGSEYQGSMASLTSFWDGLNDLMGSVALAGVQPDVQLGTPHFFRVYLRVRIPSTVDETYAKTRVQDAVHGSFNWASGRFGESVTIDGIIRAVSLAVPTTVVLTTEVLSFEVTDDWSDVLEQGADSPTWTSMGGQEWITPEYYEFAVIDRPTDVLVEVVKLQTTGRSRF